MDHRPRRIRDHGVTPRPVAPKAQALCNGPGLSAYAPSPRRRIGALLVDAVMFLLLAVVAFDMNQSLGAGVPLVFAWVIIRILPLTLLGQTPGQTLAGYEIRGADGGRIGPLRAAARDLLLLTAVSWLSFWMLHPRTTPAPMRTEAEGGDGRWPHDSLTNTWAVRSAALSPADAPTPATPGPASPPAR